MAFSNRWVLADGTLEKKPITIRYRENIEREFESNLYGHCVQINWQAEELDHKSGYPSAVEMLKIDDFNRRLMEVVEEDAHGLVAMILTSEGVNQWILYCRDLDELQSDLNRIPTDEGLYPIEVTAQDDSQWDTFKELRGAIKTH